MSRKPVPAHSGERSRVDVLFDKPQLLSQLFGQYDQHLVALENRLGVYITARGNRIGLEGTAEQVAMARDVLNDLYARIQRGEEVDTGLVDAAIAMADQMGKVGGLGRILGRRGLMPNPRSGTVVRNPEDLPGVIRDLKGGRVEFRNDRTGIVHSVIGRKSFTEDQLKDNLYAFVDAINRSKPNVLKGVYVKSLSISTTMSPGINLGVAQTIADASAASS